jgi:acetyl-CoA carboxylase biotin carboxyl carrier protein
MFSLDEIKEIIATVDKSGLSKFELECDEFYLVLKKDGANKGNCIGKVQQEVKDAEESEETLESEYAEITAPMVGTFYAGPEPGAEPFVKIGTKITEETVVCILEAMKLFTEIEGEIAGEITEILAEDGQLVEYGQPLFKVKMG